MRLAPEQKRSLASGFPEADGDLPNGSWKLPLALAIGIHLLVLGSVLSSGSLFNRPALPEIYTVNLFNAVEPGPPAPPAPAPKPEPKAAPPPPPEPAVVKKVEPAAKKEIPAAAAKPAPPPVKPAISEKPIKAKTAADLAKIRELRSSLAAQHAREAEKAAEQRVEQALASIRDLYQKEKATLPPSSAAAPAQAETPPSPEPDRVEKSGEGTAGGGDGILVEAAIRRYLVAVHSRIQAQWALPDLQGWDDSLEAVMVIKIRRDGIITNRFFEKRTDNLHFNQNVEKAIRAASPLPPFPPELKEAALEIGFRFRPGELL